MSYQILLRRKIERIRCSHFTETITHTYITGPYTDSHRMLAKITPVCVYLPVHGQPKVGRSFTERDEARLRLDLTAYLKPRPLDLERVSRTFFDLDRDRNGFLSVQQVSLKVLQRDTHGRLIIVVPHT